MSVFYSVLLGLLQGFTEFLPISSSGHLVLFSRIFTLDSSLTFDLCVHVATALAVIVYCRREIMGVVKNPTSPISLALVSATLVTAVLILILKKPVESLFDGAYLGVFFLLSSVLLAFSAWYRPKHAAKLSVWRAAVIGAAQGLAVFPGLTRSGTVFAAGNALGLEPDDNASFTFLLSVPVILGSAAVGAISGELEPMPFLPLICGFAAAFFAGLISLGLIKRVFSGRKLLPFAIYTAALGVFVTLNDCFLFLF